MKSLLCSVHIAASSSIIIMHIPHIHTPTSAPSSLLKESTDETLGLRSVCSELNLKSTFQAEKSRKMRENHFLRPRSRKLGSVGDRNSRMSHKYHSFSQKSRKNLDKPPVEHTIKAPFKITDKVMLGNTM